MMSYFSPPLRCGKVVLFNWLCFYHCSNFFGCDTYSRALCTLMANGKLRKNFPCVYLFCWIKAMRIWLKLMCCLICCSLMIFAGFCWPLCSYILENLGQGLINRLKSLNLLKKEKRIIKSIKLTISGYPNWSQIQSAELLWFICQYDFSIELICPTSIQVDTENLQIKNNSIRVGNQSIIIKMPLPKCILTTINVKTHLFVFWWWGNDVWCYEKCGRNGTRMLNTCGMNTMRFCSEMRCCCNWVWFLFRLGLWKYSCDGGGRELFLP